MLLRKTISTLHLLCARHSPGLWVGPDQPGETNGTQVLVTTCGDNICKGPLLSPPPTPTDCGWGLGKRQEAVGARRPWQLPSTLSSQPEALGNLKVWSLKITGLKTQSPHPRPRDERFSAMQTSVTCQLHELPMLVFTRCFAHFRVICRFGSSLLKSS